MDKKTFALAALIILLVATIAQAAYATWVSRAFKIGDAKDINLNGQAIGNGIISGSDTSVSGASCGAGQYITVSGSTWSCGTPAMNLVSSAGDMSEFYSTYGQIDYMMNATRQGNNATFIGNPLNVSLGSSDSNVSIYVANKSYSLTSTNLTGVFRVSNITLSSSSTNPMKIGFKNNFSVSNPADFIGWLDVGGVWYITAGNTTNWNKTATTIANGDSLIIVANSSSLKYYKNGVLQMTETTNISTLPLFAGVSTRGVSSASYIDINYISFKKYI